MLGPGPWGSCPTSHSLPCWEGPTGPCPPPVSPKFFFVNLSCVGGAVCEACPSVAWHVGGCPGGISCLPPLCTDMSHGAGGACARLSAAQHYARSLPGACQVEVVGLGAAGARRARGYSPCRPGIAALCTPDRVGLYRGEGGGGCTAPSRQQGTQPSNAAEHCGLAHH